MSDVFTKDKRSQVMSRIRGKGNLATELWLVNLLRKKKISGWRRHQKVFGNPDFVFPKHRVAVFVDGCFWHGCSIHYKKPAGNASFWEKKLSANRCRDKMVTKTLKKDGWIVLRFWEHELVASNEDAIARKISTHLKA